MELDAPPIVPEGEPMPDCRRIAEGVRLWRGSVYRWHRHAKGWLRCDDEKAPPEPEPVPLAASEEDVRRVAASPAAAVFREPAAYRDPSSGERIEWDGRRLLWPGGEMLHLPDGAMAEDWIGRVWSRCGAVLSVTDVDWRHVRPIG